MMHVQQVQVKKTPELSLLCHQAKNLYNYANWIIRDTLEKTGKEGERFWWRWQDLHSLLIPEDVFKAIPSQIAIEVLRQLDQNWKSFFASIKKWKTAKEDFLGRPDIPRFLKRNGETVVHIDYGAFTVQKDGSITFARDCLPAVIPPNPIKKILNLVSSKRDARRGSLCMIRVLPRKEYYIFEFVYEQAEMDLKLDKTRILGIDLGVNNLVTCVTNYGAQPFVIRGGIVKAVNQYYNKRRANLKSTNDIYFNALVEKYNGNKIETLRNEPGYARETHLVSRVTRKRNNVVKDCFHKTSRYIIEYCKQNNIGTIIIGYNEGWKQSVDLGKRNNQNFVQLPFLKLKEMIQYKSKLVGIDVIETDEAYTSKCSAIDAESIEYHDNYLGKRLHRGLFSSARGILVNADVNGAYNIIRKVFPEVLTKGIGDARLHPVSISIGNKHSRKTGDVQSTRKSVEIPVSHP